MTCSKCKVFAPNPYNPNVGACMASADDYKYAQVDASMEMCSLGHHPFGDDLSLKMKKKCPRCGRWVDRGKFVYSSKHTPRICIDCEKGFL